MRRLLVLVASLVFVDTMLFAALTPLLALFAHELHLSPLAAGMLVAAYPAGTLIGALPGGLFAARAGSRRAVLVGLGLMAASSLAFGLASGFAMLLVARLLQGIASAFTWSGAFSWLLASAPRERRGELIGSAMGAAVVGALFGPVVGVVAALTGRAATFSALVALAGLLALWCLRLESPPPAETSLTRLALAFRNSRFAAGLALLAVASLLVGIVSVLGPLHLAGTGWSAAAIGAVWLISAAIEAAGAPLVGRVSDRSGTLRPVRLALGVGLLAAIALGVSGAPVVYAAVLVIASVAFGVLFIPAFALIAEGADESGLAQGLAFGFMNAAWAAGAAVGPAAAGAVAGATSDSVAFVLAAIICGATLLGAAASKRGFSVSGIARAVLQSG